MNRRALWQLIVAAYVSALFIVARADTLPLVTGNSYPPFTDSNLAGGGLATELVKQVFLELGEAPSIEFLPWKRGYKATLAGQYAATFPYLKTPAREEEMYYSVPLYPIRYLLFIREDLGQIARPENLGQGRVCTPLGYAKDPLLAELIEKKVLEEISPRDLTNCFELIKKNRVDMVMANELVAKQILSHQPELKNGLRTVDKIQRFEWHHLVASKASPESIALIDSFNRKFESLLSAGILDPIYNRHLGFNPFTHYPFKASSVDSPR